MSRCFPALARAMALFLLSAGLARGGDGCAGAIAAAEQQSPVPAGILRAIGIVESGRPDPLTGRTQAWPFSVNAGGTSRFFDSSEAAVAFVRQAWARGVRSIDVGCMQVSLMYHPDAFASLQDAFAPDTNVRYATAFLLGLYKVTGDWTAATGYYHSSHPILAEDYARRVRAVMHGDLPNVLPAGPVALAGAATVQVRVIGPGTPMAAPAPAPMRLPRVYHP